MAETPDSQPHLIGYNPDSEEIYVAEADGVASHGLAYIPIYAQHVECGKVDGLAEPLISRPRPAVVAVDEEICEHDSTIFPLGCGSMCVGTL